jgi:tetratricopeptide (TPR) repeat protein
LRWRLRAISAALVLSFTQSACSSPPPPAPPRDAALESSHKLARFALRSGNPQQAEILFERALARAYERDDIVAIGNIGYELALTRLRNGDPEGATEQAREIREEMLRRGVSPFAELYLVEAVAEYRAGRPTSAQIAARQVLRHASHGESAAIGRAYFVLGMVAAESADEPGVASALAELQTASEPGLQADYLELKGRHATLRGEPETAMRDFEGAAEIRQMLEDYVGMARGLAYAGSAAEQGGSKGVAADFYFRAGRSAAEREDWHKATLWLEKAASLADESGDSVLKEDAQSLLRSIKGEQGGQETGRTVR